MKRSAVNGNGVAGPKKQLVQYTIKTTSSKYISYPNSVDIQLCGENGEWTESSWISLQDEFDFPFSAGRTSVFKKRISSVGIPTMIRLRLTGSNKIWACERVQVEFNRCSQKFPVYDWIDHNPIAVTIDQADLPQTIKNEVVLEERRKEIELNKCRFPWVKAPTNKNDLGWNLPRFVDTEKSDQLPIMFRMDDLRRKKFYIDGINGSLRGFFKKVITTKELKDFASYANLYTMFESERDFSSEAPNLYNWQSDREFGRLQMDAVTPLSFQLCSRLPPNCLITNEHVKSLLQNSLETEMKNGRIFIADYSEKLKDVKRNDLHENPDKPLYCPDAICIYYVNSSKDLVPIAIQLKPGCEDSIFTPNDSKYDWLLAKLYFRVAEGNFHEWAVHFLHTHGVMETVAVSLFRNLPRAHPIYKLLRPHLQAVSAINAEARRSLIPASSTANTAAMSVAGYAMARESFKRFKWNDLNIPEVIQRQGLDSEHLIKFPYRDDAKTIWKDVANDTEIKGWLEDLTKEGFGWQDGKTHEVPTCIETVDDLVEFVTTIMFTSSAQHAAVNFKQYNHYKFIPNAPLAMRLPIHKKGEGSYKRCLQSLPNTEMATNLITIVYALSQVTDNEEYLGDYPMKLFSDMEAQDALQKYKLELKKISTFIKRRNKASPTPYDSLLPEKVPNSIDI